MPPAPPAFHILAKPTGSICNLGCEYCFFLSKEKLYPDSKFRMSEELLESYLKQYIEAQKVPFADIAWQGGEPMLMGLDFFRKSVELVEKYRPPHMKVQYTIQTNGTTVDAEWCEFFKENNFLVGISIDGPRDLHDAYRKDKQGKPTFDRVMKGLELLQKHKVDFNILTTVNAANSEHPLEVYRFFRDELKAQFIQFIAIVERDNETGFQEGDQVTDRSVRPEQYGKFLNTIFNEWLANDVGNIYVRMFDGALASWVNQPGSECIFAPTCGTALVLEHNGDLYACDHFVEPDHLLGNILETPMIELVASEQQSKFGQDKKDTLPQYCLDCEVRFACHGGCPKNRITKTPTGDDGLNYLCPAYKQFFAHIDRPMRIMANLLQQQKPPADIKHMFQKAGRNEPCPCGSEKKFKQCHGAL